MQCLGFVGPVYIRIAQVIGQRKTERNARMELTCCIHMQVSLFLLLVCTVCTYVHATCDLSTLEVSHVCCYGYLKLDSIVLDYD